MRRTQAHKARQRARTRTRALIAPPSNDNARIEPEPPPFDTGLYEDEFADLPLDDFVDAAPTPALTVISNEVEDAEIPFDPPDEEDIAAMKAAAEEAASADEDFDAPFDPPDVAELENPFIVEEADEPEPPPRAQFAPRAEPAAPPLPAITMHLAWERPEFATQLRRLAADPRLANAEFSDGPGGVDAAIAQCRDGHCPDLLLLDTTLRHRELLSALDRLADVVARDTKVVVLGAHNDISLLRDLSQRGVSQYIVPPVNDDDLAQLLCTLYAETDPARVVAVIGARGGIGASTLARNLAWSIAERRDVPAALLDLDFAFGGEGKEAAELPALDEDETLAGFITRPSARLQVLSLPPSPERGAGFDAAAFDDLLRTMRRTSRYIVLDLPHTWSGWVRRALACADDIVLVAGADLASLRNADNMMKQLKAQRGEDSLPLVVLSMTGVPKKPEIPFKDFAETLGTTPVATFTFEPGMYGQAADDKLMLGEIAPGSKHAAAVEVIATCITGLEPLKRRAKPVRKPILALEPIAPITKDDPLPLRAESTSERDDSILELREISLASDPAPALTLTEEAPLAEPLQLNSEEPLTLIETGRPGRVDDHITAARRAQAALRARQIERHPPRRRSTGLVRAAVAVLAFGAVGGWYVQSERNVASASIAAVQPQEAEATIAVPAPTDHVADYQSALALLEGGAALDGLTRLNTLAQSGFVMAQYRLAKLYESGAVVARDLEAARQWTERAANGGNRYAMHDLGVYYAHGEGAGRDDAAALRWFEQAAELGVADSQFNLGVLYESGRGVEANASEAFYWFLLAAQHGDETALDRISALETSLTPDEAAAARERASVFQPRTPNPTANGAFAALEPPAPQPVEAQAPEAAPMNAN